MTTKTASTIIQISSKKFLGGCLLAACVMFLLGALRPFPAGVLAFEIILTVLLLFVFGSIKYRIDKNAITYGAVIVIIATFWWSWWPRSTLCAAVTAENYGALWDFIYRHFLTLRGLDHLVHADTMLFIMGLTLFVSVIAQTRLLETISFAVLERNKGYVLPTVAIITAIVSFSSGILDGVSMIGLTIRTLVIILFLAKAPDATVIFSVIISTVVTTVCGMWLAYGEPPNLIMKANLIPHLTDAFFLRYCLPVAVGSYLVVFWNLRKWLKGTRVKMVDLDIIDRYTADVRFLQASRHGEVLTPIEFIHDHRKIIGPYFERLQQRLHTGEPLGSALVREGVPEGVRRKILGQFIAEELADALDRHYVHEIMEDNDAKNHSAQKIRSIIETMHHKKVRAQKIGMLSFIPFIGFLVAHALDHRVPLFWASFTAFSVALIGIYRIPKMKRLATREARHEYQEYLFLLPLFFSITLLQKSGFFEHMTHILHQAIQQFGASHVAYMQYTTATILSAILDNNVVADFASRGLHGLEIGLLYLLSMAQIAGYAAGGCWTHIGSAQSVVAYAFVQREIDEHYTPFQWIKLMTPVIIQISILMAFVIYIEGYLLGVIR
jgi:hypothetical protein